MPESSAGYIEVTDPEGEVVRYPITSRRVLIGRSSEADLRLDRHSVSRRHAELVRDPFGRWWVRDLGSRSGLRVNDIPVSEIVLQPDDVFTVGRFSLRFPRGDTGGAARLPSASDSGSAAKSTVVPREDATDAGIDSLTELPAPKIDVVHMSSLAEVGRQLMHTADAHERLALLCRTIVRTDFNGCTAMALRLDKRRPDDPLEMLAPPQSVKGWPEEANYVSRNLVRALVNTHAPVLASSTTTESGAVEMSLSPDRGAMAAVACPLFEDDDVLDLLYVILPVAYGKAEWLALITLAVKQYQQAQMVWAARAEAKAHAAIERDLESAREIQESLVPRALLVPGLDLAIEFDPCRWVGGDYVDVVPMSDGRVLLVVADVAGKGLPASLIALSLHSTVHTCLRSGVGLVPMITALNDHFCEHLDEQSFVTMVCVLIEPASGVIECVNCGHVPAIIFSPDGSSRELQRAVNFPLGLEAQTIEVQRSSLEAGQMLAMVTDGLTEIEDEDGRLLGVAGLMKRVGDLVAASPAKRVTSAKIAKQLTKLLNTLEGGRLRRDDRSFLLVRRTGA
jgi:phosphoserine phosphatase RsbU/P